MPDKPTPSEKLPPQDNARDMWLLTPLGSMGRTSIQVEQYEELRALAVKLAHRAQPMGQPKTSARWEPNGTAESVHAAAAAYARCPGGTGSRYRERLLEAALAWAEEPFVQPTEQERPDPLLRTDGTRVGDQPVQNADGSTTYSRAPLAHPPSDVSPAYCPYCPHCHPRTANATTTDKTALYRLVAASIARAWERGKDALVDEIATALGEVRREVECERAMADGKCDEHVPLATAIALCTGELDEIAPGSEAGDLRRAFNHGVQACIEAFRQYTPHPSPQEKK